MNSLEFAMNVPQDEPGNVINIHFVLFGTDGVSLQYQELARELRRRKWRVFACASDVPLDDDGLRIPDLDYWSEEAKALRQRLFHPAKTPPEGRFVHMDIQEIRNLIYTRAERIRGLVEANIQQNYIPILHIRNIMSLPFNLPATLAFFQLAEERPDLQFVMHHHDIYWEGPNAVNFRSPYREISDLMDRIMCPDLPNATHLLINPIAAEALQAEKGIIGSVIPDGFDFDRPVKELDEPAFRRDLKILTGENKEPITENDLVIGVMARVVINKAIELAIQFTWELQQARARLEDAPDGIGTKKRQFTKKSRIVLLIAQGQDRDEKYFARLLDYAEQIGVTLADGKDIVVPDSQHTPDGKHYPFYSSYQSVDFVCYSSVHEGFGNQLIEAVWAKRPIAVFEYPVFQRYVCDHLPHYISLGDTQSLESLELTGGLHRLKKESLDEAIDKAIAVLLDSDLERQWTEENAVQLRQFCGIEHVTDQYLDLYNDVRAKMRDLET